jgi:hypothetical protein
MDYSAMSDNRQQDTERQAFLEAWRRTEARARRAGGLMMTLAGMLVLAVETRGDELTALIATGLIAGGLWFIIRSGRSRIERIHLTYLRVSSQMQRALLAGFAAAYTFYQAITQSRPLFFVGSVVLVAWATWYLWRVYQVRQYEARFSSSTSDDMTEEIDPNEI